MEYAGEEDMHACVRAWAIGERQSAQAMEKERERETWAVLLFWYFKATVRPGWMIRIQALAYPHEGFSILVGE